MPWRSMGCTGREIATPLKWMKLGGRRRHQPVALQWKGEGFQSEERPCWWDEYSGNGSLPTPGDDRMVLPASSSRLTYRRTSVSSHSPRLEVYFLEEERKFLEKGGLIWVLKGIIVEGGTRQKVKPQWNHSDIIINPYLKNSHFWDVEK